MENEAPYFRLESDALRKIKDEIRSHFNVAFEKDGKKALLAAWDIDQNELMEFPLSSLVDLKAALVNRFGYPLETWFESILGDDFVLTGGVSGEPLSDNKERDGLILIQKALHALAGEAPDIERLHQLGQGIHYNYLPREVVRKRLVYFVNGHRVFKGKFTDPENGRIEWMRVHNIVDEGVSFNAVSGLITSDPWSSIMDEAELTAAADVDLQETYRDLLTLLNAWRFEHHDVMVKYLAAYIMAVPILSAVGNFSVTYLTGNPDATQLFVMEILGGSDGEIYPRHILESSMSLHAPTKTEMGRAMNGCSNLFVLNEAGCRESETGNYARRKRIDDLRHAAANLTERICDRGTGYQLFCPLFVRTEEPPKDKNFKSRILEVNVESVVHDFDGHIDESLSAERHEQLKRDISVGLIPRIPEIIAQRNELRRTLGNHRRSTRFWEKLLVPLTVYGMVGEDPEDLYLEMSDVLETEDLL